MTVNEARPKLHRDSTHVPGCEITGDIKPELQLVNESFGQFQALYETDSI